MDIKLLRILSDLIIIAIGVGLIWLKSTPTRRGFFCDDESIRYPFNGEIISGQLMDALLFATGTILIILTEYALRTNTQSRKYLSGFLVPEWANSTYRLCVDYLVAALLLFTGIDVFKNEVGSLRPSFIQRCGLNIDISNCAVYNNTYITDYECYNAEDVDVRRSFPSAHSAFSAFITVFCVIYMQVKWITSEETPLRLWKHILQAVVAGGFFYICLTRYTDNMHHPIDIIVGYGIGAIVGLFTAVHVCGLTSSPPVNPERRPLLVSSPTI